jgi:FkbM family methyltransferase
MNWVHERLIVRQAAVGSVAGRVELCFCPDNLGGATVKADQGETSTFTRTADYLVGMHSVVAPMVTLDEEFPYDLPIKFLKIDAEGYEPQVLAGANRLLQHRCIDYIMLEALHEVAGNMWNSLLDKITEICALGYAPFTFDGDSNLTPTTMTDIANGRGLTTRNVILKALR